LPPDGQWKKLPPSRGGARNLAMAVAMMQVGLMCE
jgi:hypothetical protein